MDTCAICGKSQEGITLELEEDDEQMREKHVCKSCSKVIASIAVKAVESELKPLIDELKSLIEFMATSKIQEYIAEFEKTTSEVDDFPTKNEELFEDEELADRELIIDEYSNDEKAVAETSKEALIDELLSFAKDMDIGEDGADSLSRDIVELFWKSKGMRNTFSASTEIQIKIRQVEKMARTKIIENIFSASNDGPNVLDHVSGPLHDRPPYSPGRRRDDGIDQPNR